MPVVANPNVGIPVLSSITLDAASASNPVMAGMVVPTMAINLGCNSSAALTTSSINLLSSPIIASISVNADIYTMLSMSYQRGSSWVVYVELQPEASCITIMPPSS